MGNMLWIYFAQIASQSVYPVKFDIVYIGLVESELPINFIHLGALSNVMSICLF